ncbi:conserved hypothetical protein [Tenacibaculum maritimum]|nr:conserved hypothetical protein [Tenacibaculum maritimum]
MVKKERELKSLHTNVRKEQEQTDIRKSKLLLTFSYLHFATFIDIEVIRLRLVFILLSQAIYL